MKRASKIITWADAIDCIVGRIPGEDEIRRKRKAANDQLFDKLGDGDVRSKAGTVDSVAKAPGWVLANWPIPAALWRVMQIYNPPHWASTPYWPGNEPRLPGWPPANADVKLRGIRMWAEDINRCWPPEKKSSPPRSHLPESTKAEIIALCLKNPEWTKDECKARVPRVFKIELTERQWRAIFKGAPRKTGRPKIVTEES